MLIILENIIAKVVEYTVILFEAVAYRKFAHGTNSPLMKINGLISVHTDSIIYWLVVTSIVYKKCFIKTNFDFQHLTNEL